MRRKISSQKIQEFEIYLMNEERSRATVEKYVRDVKRFSKFVQSEEIDKREVLDYKSKLGETYAVTSANSMIAAMNCFLRKK